VEKMLGLLQARLSECPTWDRAAFARRLNGLRRRGRETKTVGRVLEQLSAEVAAAVARLHERRAALPQPHFNNNLPINARREAIAAAIHDHQIVVLCGENGSGKTT
jgi:ATP-dependent helicase HrpA